VKITPHETQVQDILISLAKRVQKLENPIIFVTPPVGWTDWRCPAKKCNKIIYNDSQGSEWRIVDHLIRSHTEIK